MIEVTDEMLQVARSMQSFELMIKRIIELHEQSKSKQEKLSIAVTALIKELQEDQDFAFGWKCNLAMASFDAGCDIVTANRGADIFLERFASIKQPIE